MAAPKIFSGNLTVSISDHLPQFLVGSKIFFSIPHISNPINMKETDQNLIKKLLSLIIFQLTGIIWCLDQTGTLIYYTKLSLKTSSTCLHLCPSKNISKNKLKFKCKLWITSGLQRSISIKNHYLSKFLRLKYPSKKIKPK